MRIPISALYLILILTTACASKRGASDKYASEPGYDDQAAMGVGFDDPPALPELGAAPMAQPDMSPGMAAAVFASPAPSKAGPANADAHIEAIEEVAPDSFETMGADSIDQMLIFTAQLALEVDFASSAKTIDAAVQLGVTAGGYVAQMTDTTLHLRVPSRHFRKVMKQIEDLGDLRSRQVQALDVSEEYNDLGVRLDNLRATRERIEKLLNQSKDLAQILIIEKELERVTFEIDRIEGRMRMLASQAAFSTIAIAFSERPQRVELKQAGGEALPPPTTPRTLRSSAVWVHQVDVHNLLTIND
jgi:hypothetical protein